MKKKLIITLSIVAAVAVLGFGLYQSGATSAEPTLSSDEISGLVLEQYPGSILGLEYEEDAKDAFYKVELENNGNLYTIKLNGNSGEVIDLKVDELVTPNNNAQNNNSDKEKEQDQSETNESPSKEQKQEDSANEKQEPSQKEDTNTEEDSSNAMISEAMAREIALAEWSGTVTEIELDEDEGRYAYEVEIENGEDEATVEIDAYTGNVLVLEIDKEEDND
ncbi:PepSY domain-containing protein [Oceanobacillus sp. CF4.6]|uniref:PepSY domain-containing protein n=1 Tax=Oceanobacillus sp. CF4.6 TaxID=3373080 RepID=UPI003EE745A4